MNSITTCNDFAFVYLYFKGACDLSRLDFNGNSLLHLAAQSNSINIARLLRHIYKLSSNLQGGSLQLTGDDSDMNHDSLIYFDINRQNMQGMSPIFLAILSQNLQLFKFLLENKCDITQREQVHGETVKDCIFRYCDET